ncbi:MAG: hypothetical protein LBJ71_01650 [Holosporaceae bacterium]|jgi:hypothetical protein|nr:hypothetical protein [Holosporaceae bacterium]
MMKNTALLQRQGTALFNFIGMKHQNDKHIGDLTIGDFIEIIAFLTKMERQNENN